MLFNEIYSAYYNVVAKILKRACEEPIDRVSVRKIVEKNAFGDSILNIEPALYEGRWQLLNEDGSAVINNPPTMPLTTLQKRWLKAIALDPRIALFDTGSFVFPDVEPLFLPEDICVFDKYLDGDPYDSPEYQKIFKEILDAKKGCYPLEIEYENRKGRRKHTVMKPEYIEYSEKDDKFRAIGPGIKNREIVNIGRIRSCRRYEKLWYETSDNSRPHKKEILIFELINERNALERVLLHFAHFEKEVERLEGNSYRVKLVYDVDDETEIVIRVLSFGPMIRVVSPEPFIELIKERLLRQNSCEI